MILRKAAKKGSPMTAPTSQPLRVSMMNNLSVDLLKPCRSSMTNVLYSDKGIDVTDERAVRSRV